MDFWVISGCFFSAFHQGCLFAPSPFAHFLFVGEVAEEGELQRTAHWARSGSQTQQNRCSAQGRHSESNGLLQREEKPSKLPTTPLIAPTTISG